MANPDDLYNKDETAWLEMMARLAAERRFAELDYEHLHEFLTDRQDAIGKRFSAVSEPCFCTS